MNDVIGNKQDASRKAARDILDWVKDIFDPRKPAEDRPRNAVARQMCQPSVNLCRAALEQISRDGGKMDPSIIGALNGVAAQMFFGANDEHHRGAHGTDILPSLQELSLACSTLVQKCTDAHLVALVQPDKDLYRSQ